MTPERPVLVSGQFHARVSEGVMDRGLHQRAVGGVIGWRTAAEKEDIPLFNLAWKATAKEAREE